MKAKLPLIAGIGVGSFLGGCVIGVVLTYIAATKDWPILMAFDIEAPE